jgi:hypothetical protein
MLERKRKADVESGAIDIKCKINNIMKTCKKCNEEKDITLFSKDKDGLQIWCKSCCKQYLRKWDLSNSQRSREKDKLWQQANSEKCNSYTASRRAIRLKATPLWATSKEEKLAIRNLYKQAKLLTEQTGVEYQVDHIVPLKSTVVQGLHCISNLQILPASKNKSKGNKYWPDMP